MVIKGANTYKALNIAAGMENYIDNDYYYHYYYFVFINISNKRWYHSSNEKSVQVQVVHRKDFSLFYENKLKARKRNKKIQ